MSESVLVTGGSGYVAGWCIVELLPQGYTVRSTLRNAGRAEAVRSGISTQIDPGGRLTFVVADLLSDAGWSEAVAGCDHVLHVASPMGAETARTADALVRPAREGALRVLRAAVQAGVKRVVMTSSCAAATPLASQMGADTETDETAWGDPEDQKNDFYRLSKTLAERAAWDFMAEKGGATELVTLLPSAIFGPVLSMEGLGSVRVIKRLLDGSTPRVPRLGLNIIDVRDLALAHVTAMTEPKAAGQRFIIHD